MVKRFWRQIAGQLRRIKDFVQESPLYFVMIVVLLLLFGLIIQQTIKANNLGFSSKTFWDWLDLLVVPIALAFVVWFLNKSEKDIERTIAEERAAVDREIAKDAQHQTILQSYFDRMTGLLIEGGLRVSKPDDEVRTIARAHTLAALRELDGARRGQVVRFLYESGLIDKEDTIISLRGANLTDAVLNEPRHSYEMSSDSVNAKGWGINLRNANLSKTHLGNAQLVGADLSGAELSEAYMSKANLFQVNFHDANLTEAMLSHAILIESDFEGAILTKTLFFGSDLRDAQINLGQIPVHYLVEATMPDGRRYDEWIEQRGGPTKKRGE